MAIGRLRVAFGLGLVAAVTLMIELLLMREFDVILYTEMSYMIISCALFAFGLAGVYSSLRPLKEEADIAPRIVGLSIAFGIFTLLLMPLININPFDYNAIDRTPLRELFWFGVIYFVLIIPFFLSGLIFTLVFNSYAKDIRYLYCFDLCGAAIGCVAFLPFLPLVGPGGLLFAAAGLSLLAALLFSGGREPWHKLLAPLALVLIAIPYLHHGYFDFRPHVDKRHVRAAENDSLVEVTRWDPLAKIDVVREYLFNPKTHRMDFRWWHLAYDGGTQSSHYFLFDGNLPKLRANIDRDMSTVVRQFVNRSVLASHYLRADRGSDVLILGAAGGMETKAALLYNAKSVDAIEMIGAVVDLGKNAYARQIGNIYNDPRVNFETGEGRTFLRGTNKKYDIIQIFSNHTSSAIAAGGGAGHGVYLHTVEAYEEYFSALKPDGILQLGSNIYPRQVTTAAAAWRQLGRHDFRRHVLVFEQSERPDSTPLLMVKMTPWTPAEVAKVNAFMMRPGVNDLHDKYRLVENPLDPKHSVLSDEFYSGSLSPELIARVPYRIEPPTDEQPYFNFLRKNFAVLQVSPATFVSVSVAGWLNSEHGKYGLPKDIAHFFIVGAVGIAFAILFILLPLFLAPVGRQRWKGEFTSLAYFSCLGAGFIIIELVFTQLFMELIGFPLYTYSVVIFTMLAAAGLGSLAADRLDITPLNRWWLPFAGTIGLGMLLKLTHAGIFDHYLSAPMAARIFVAMVMIFPVGFFMGMCMPLGILALRDKPKGAIPWAWGMNGLLTTLGGLAAVLISMLWGFNVALDAGFAIYALAAATFWRLRLIPASEPESHADRPEPFMGGMAADAA